MSLGRAGFLNELHDLKQMPRNRYYAVSNRYTLNLLQVRLQSFDLHTHRKKAHLGFLFRASLVKVASKEFGLRVEHQFICSNTTNGCVTHPLDKIRNIQFFIGRAV
jgi:hypothetical protein